MFPNEIYENILSYVSDLKTLFNCRLVCFVFKEIVSNNTKIDNRDKRDEKNILSLKILSLFPKLKYLDIPIIFPFYIFEFQNFENLERITLKNVNILEIISSLEDMILKNKTVKIYSKNCVYWLKNGFYGKYEKYMNEFNEIDGQLMDVCRCKTLISNKKPYHYFPVDNFIYLSSELTCFDYIPFRKYISFSWQPVKSEYRDKTDFKNLNKLTETIKSFKDPYPNIKRYEMPILKDHIPHLNKIFPNIESFTIFSDMKLHNINLQNTENKIIDLKNLPTIEQYIDSFFL
jgi:hypothetical protein